jgi:hypothetical protein
MRIIVTGASNWLDTEKIRNELIKLPIGATILHGENEGVDIIAAKIAEELKLETEVWPADWDTHGPRADRLRNGEMVNSDVDLCIAFLMKDARHNWDCVRKARSARIETIIVEQDNHEEHQS